MASGTGVWVSDDDGINGYYNFPTEDSFRWHQSRYALGRRGIDEEAMLDCVAQVEEGFKSPDWYRTFMGSVGNAEPIPPAPPRNGWQAGFGRVMAGVTLRSRKNKSILCHFTPTEFYSGNKDGIFEWYEETPEDNRSAMDIIVDMNAKLDGKFSDVNSPIFNISAIGAPAQLPKGVPSVEEAKSWTCLPSDLRESFVQKAYDYHFVYRSFAIKAQLAEEVVALMKRARPLLEEHYAKRNASGTKTNEYRVKLTSALSEHHHALASMHASVVEQKGVYVVSGKGLRDVLALCDAQRLDFICSPVNAPLVEGKKDIEVRVEKRGSFYVADWEFAGLSGSVYDTEEKVASKKAIKAANAAAGRVERVQESALPSKTRISTADNRDAIAMRILQKHVKDAEALLKDVESSNSYEDFASALGIPVKMIPQNQSWNDEKEFRLVGAKERLARAQASLDELKAKIGELKEENLQEFGQAQKVMNSGLTRLWHSKDHYLNVRGSRIQRPKDSPFVYISFPADEGEGFFGKVPDHKRLVFELGDGFYKPTPASRVTKDDYYFTLEKIDATEQPVLKKKFRI
ncbi:MAG: hypothetical protein ACRCXD_09825 [Luteolibacter sp.]